MNASDRPDRTAPDAFALPAGLPAPVDDGGADHLAGAALPDLFLDATDGRRVRLSALERAVIFLYPRTGLPEKLPGPEWDAIPGARGCTPQACAFRDLHDRFRGLDTALYGLSTQTVAYQQEFVARKHITFPLLSDADLRLTQSLNLPTFDYDVATLGGGGPDTLLRRMAWYVADGRIGRVWYPVFPPDENAGEIARWLMTRGGESAHPSPPRR